MLSIAGYEWGWDNARALLGILLIYGVCWVLSEKRKLFPFRLIIGATIMQFVFALILFGIPFVRAILFKANDVVDGLQNATRAGTSFERRMPNRSTKLIRKYLMPRSVATFERFVGIEILRINL